MPPDEHHTSDASLVLRALDGETAAFTVLFNRHYAPVREFAFRVLLDGHAADDVAQESFICAARKLGTLRDGQAFVAWVYSIATNVARSHLRAQCSHDRKIRAAGMEGTEAVNDGDAADGRAVLALNAMRSLPPQQREAVALVIMDGLSHAEAASRLGCAESTVSWRIFCAKKSLRRKLQS